MRWQGWGAEQLLGRAQEAWEQSRPTTPPKQAPRATLRHHSGVAVQAASEVSDLSHPALKYQATCCRMLPPLLSNFP